MSDKNRWLDWVIATARVTVERIDYDEGKWIAKAQRGLFSTMNAFGDSPEQAAARCLRAIACKLDPEGDDS